MRPHCVPLMAPAILPAMRVRHRIKGAVLIVIFGALLLSGVRGGWLVGRLDNIGMPQELLAVEQRLRVIALAQVVFGLLGLCSGVALFMGKRWGYAALAAVLTAAGVVGGLARAFANPATRLDPSWGLVASTAGLAVAAWYRARATDRD